jgi:hypothetical protein
MSGEGSGSWQERDVFTGPAVERAMRAAVAVAAGSLVRTAFSAYDTGDLIDLEGASFIGKLPEAVPPNPRLYWGRQWFIQGHATDPIEYGPRWRDFYVEQTRCWLLDVAVLKNWFAERPSQEVIALFRSKSLDPARRWSREANRLTIPASFPLSPDDGFHLFAECREQPVPVGEDIPLAAWVLNRPGISYRDVPAVAACASLACIWCVRFQESFPGEGSSDAEPSSAGRPATR